MAPPRFNGKDGLLARVNFPLYSLQMLTSRHVLVAGGGGSAKTGVANGFEVFEISHDGKQFIAEEVIRHETGPLVVMNCAVRTTANHTFLVAGQEGHSQLYTVRSRVEGPHSESANSGANGGTTRKRRTSETNGTITGDSEKPSNRLTFSIALSDCVKTDFSSEEPLQKIVRVSLDGRLMVTGGVDGHVRLWTFPQMKPLKDINAHTNDVDDVDFSIDSKLVASVSKDGKSFIWDAATGKQVAELDWPTPNGSKYIPKRCRFAAVEEKRGTSRIFVVTNPVGRAGKCKAYLQLWDSQDWSLRKVAACDESYASLAVRDDGRFVATGTMFSGSVHIYVAFSLQKVHVVKSAHHMFVTAVEFLPVSSPLAVASTAEAAVVSISVDNRVCIHTLRYRNSMPAWLAVVLIIVTLFVTFLFCSYIGL